MKKAIIAVGTDVKTATTAANLQGFTNVRVIRPGAVYTQDYEPNRVNLKVDENDIVTDVTMG